MLEGNVFGDLVPAGQPGVIYGPPETAKPPPVPSGFRPTASGGLEFIPGGPADPDTKQANEEGKTAQQQALAFYERALNAHNLYGEGIAPRDPATQTLVDVTPGNFANAYSSPERRAAKNYVEEFIRAKLRRESGAAIPEAEMAQEYPVYFAVPGDQPADLERKRLLREQVIESLKVQAGPQASKALLVGGKRLDGETILPATAASLNERGQLAESKLVLPPERQAERPSYDQISFSGEKGPENPFNAEQQSAYDAFNKANPTATAEQLRAFGTSIGVDINNAEAIVGARDKGAGVQPGSTATKGLTAQEAADVDRIVAKNNTTAGALGAGLGSGASLAFLDEAAAGIGAVGQSLGGEGSFLDNYRHNTTVNRAVTDRLQHDHPWAYTGGQLAGSFATLPVGMGTAPATSALATIAQGAKTGALGGALAGFGSGEGLMDSAEKAVLGGAAGGVLGGTISGVSTRLGRPRGLDPEIASAADAENVSLIRPMVDPASRGKAGALESTPGAQNIIRGGVERVAGDIEGGVGRLGAGGQVLEAGAAGDRVQGAARRFIQRSRGVADRLYNRARTLAGDATVTPRESLNQLRQELTELNETPSVNAGEIAFINEIGEDLTRGPLTVEGIRGLRRSVRGRINERNLTATQAEARAMRIIDAIQRDVTDSLPTDAATAFRRADTFYRERMEHIDDVTNRFLGPRNRPLSSEQAFQRLKSMTSPGGDGRRLASMWRDLEPQEQLDVAATIAQSLGRRDADAPFSTALFVSQTAKLSPSARRTIFGPAGAESINNLRLLSRRLDEATGDFNRSRTSGSILRNTGLQMKAFVAALMGTGGGVATGTTTGAATGVAVATGIMAGKAVKNVLSARALMSPRVSRWLAEAANANTPRQAQTMANRLGTIIAREPALAGELTPIQQSLSSQLTQPLAAEPGEDDQASQ